MEGPCETSSNGETANSTLQIIRHSPFKPCSKFSSPWFDLRVFYVRISNFQVDASTPEFLTLNYMPLSPDTLLEVNGARRYSDGVSSLLRRDRVGNKSEEATFVSTDSIRTTSSVKFEVFHKEDQILSGVLEMSNTNSNDFVGKSKSNVKRWSMNCEPEIAAASGFLKGKHIAGAELPTIEVYITGCFSGTPVILTKTLQLSYCKKHIRKGILDSIPEHETTESQKKFSPKHDLQIAEYRSCKLENEEEYRNMYWRSEYMEGDDVELSWFNAGVRVGVGIGLGICLGIGIGVGLLARTYRATTRNFKRQLG